MFKEYRRYISLAIYKESPFKLSFVSNQPHSRLREQTDILQSSLVYQEPPSYQLHHSLLLLQSKSPLLKRFCDCHLFFLIINCNFVTLLSKMKKNKEKKICV